MNWKMQILFKRPSFTERLLIVAIQGILVTWCQCGLQMWNVLLQQRETVKGILVLLSTRFVEFESLVQHPFSCLPPSLQNDVIDCDISTALPVGYTECNLHNTVSRVALVDCGKCLHYCEAYILYVCRYCVHISSQEHHRIVCCHSTLWLECLVPSSL